MYPTIEALRQTSKAGVFLICFLAHEERARRARLVTEFDEGYSIREGKADRNSGYTEHDAICSQYYFIAVEEIKKERNNDGTQRGSIEDGKHRVTDAVLIIPIALSGGVDTVDKPETVNMHDAHKVLLSDISNRQRSSIQSDENHSGSGNEREVASFDQIERSNPVSLQIVTEKSRFKKGTDAANSHLHSTCSCLICSYNTGDPLCSGEHNSERVTPNRRHFLDARGKG
ncbi:hypothetical protein ALC56_02632 [Trachymyrmex septentrionalis]|uniref:Uncharacterized protein n=1 Tax=Trachymyrmex septentrionalis TaxID=34720 RepID=A0A195FQH5_9HYME|nr:hypothetical protein ALC56_02632 [Trachymyrmex septentrionalis]